MSGKEEITTEDVIKVIAWLCDEAGGRDFRAAKARKAQRQKEEDKNKPDDDDDDDADEIPKKLDASTVKGGLFG
jgi:hypothetical protein